MTTSTISTLPEVLNTLHSIKADSLTPSQRETSRAFMTSCDFRQQYMIKAPFLCQFHSYAECLFAALLEADPCVLSYVPQPFQVRIGVKRYTPDFYVTHHEKAPQVIELKSDNNPMQQQKVEALTAYFDSAICAHFTVIMNSVVYEKKVLAENWLRICRRLHLGRYLDTQSLEEEVISNALTHCGSTLRDLIKPHGSDSCFERELAVLRLLHKGQLIMNLTLVPIHFDMEVRL